MFSKSLKHYYYKKKSKLEHLDHGYNADLKPVIGAPDRSMTIAELSLYLGHVLLCPFWNIFSIGIFFQMAPLLTESRSVVNGMLE